ncbi:MAG: helix-turn-helix domain-containing protein [Burkholderiaceae bacterium]|jgi:DNA-binding XRE family transcriptional regulator|nr:helix-turn-helix domain-containing protein [Burkholderiaceae bacterium]
MDRRYRPATLVEQLQLRRQAIEDVLAHPEWSLAQSIRHLKTSMRLTTAELAKLAGVSFRTLQDIERGRSEGSVQTMNRILGVLGLKLGVVRASAPDSDEP